MYMRPRTPAGAPIGEDNDNSPLHDNWGVVYLTIKATQSVHLVVSIFI